MKIAARPFDRATWTPLSPPLRKPGIKLDLKSCGARTERWREGGEGERNNVSLAERNDAREISRGAGRGRKVSLLSRRGDGGVDRTDLWFLPFSHFV